RLEPGRSPFDTAANWYLDFGDPGRVVRGPVFETDAGPVSALDVIHWPRPDEVLVASRGGIRRLTRLP
ncbi:MAG TPA: hypothetical protein VFM29_03015, partial [Vicinamibacteria bacterium]|nr:hypothetical protein [Vicinamibacteria bacterium]